MHLSRSSRLFFLVVLTAAFSIGLTAEADEPVIEFLRRSESKAATWRSGNPLGRYGSDTLARSANVLIELGEDKAVTLLHSLAKDPQKFELSDDFDWMTVNQRIGLLCRVVFLPDDEKQPLIPPSFGGLSLPHDSMPGEDWPEYPLLISDGVIFVLDDGYHGSGPGPNAHGYLDYCQKYGHFRKDKFTIPTQADAKKSLKLLTESTRWKNIKWSTRRYGYSEEWTLKHMTEQAENIGK